MIYISVNFFKGSRETPIQKLKVAMRVAVEEQTLDFKHTEYYDGMVCEVCGLSIDD